MVVYLKAFFQTPKMLRILLFGLLIFSGCAAAKKDKALEFIPLDAPV
jgi:hypothetical protein